MCEHYCVNMHLWIVSLNALYPVCACTMQVYLHLHVIYCHLHITMCHNVWTWCEHYSVNMYLWIVSLNALYPVCACTMQVYIHLHVIYCHLHITMCHHLWTWCEHYCVNIHLPIVSLNAIVPWMCMHNASLSTSTCNILPLAYHHVSLCVNMVWTLLCEHVCVNCFFKCILPLYVHVKNASLSTSSCTTLPFAYYHVSPYVNIVWTLLCEHPSVNIFFKHIVPCMCMYMYCTVTCILTCVSICYHVAKFVNVLTCMYACMSMYIMTVCLIIKELVTKVKVSRSPCMYTCVLTLP